MNFDDKIKALIKSKSSHSIWTFTIKFQSRWNIWKSFGGTVMQSLLMEHVLLLFQPKSRAACLPPVPILELLSNVTKLLIKILRDFLKCFLIIYFRIREGFLFRQMTFIKLKAAHYFCFFHSEKSFVFKNCSDLIVKKCFSYHVKHLKIWCWRQRICRITEQIIQTVKGQNNFLRNSILF